MPTKTKLTITICWVAVTLLTCLVLWSWWPVPISLTLAYVAAVLILRNEPRSGTKVDWIDYAAWISMYVCTILVPAISAWFFLPIFIILTLCVWRVIRNYEANHAG